MNTKSVEEIQRIIIDTITEHQIALNEGDVQAFCKAYQKFGDVDLAVNAEGQVLSDVMEGPELDLIANALNAAFGKQAHHYPEQTYPVKINGRQYQTYVDEFGVQKFVGNRAVQQLLQDPALDCQLAREAYEAGEYTIDEWTEFNAVIGSNTKEFMLTLKTSAEIENPREQ